MTRASFDPDDPSLSPATLELLLRLDGLTARLERAVVTLEANLGDAPEAEDQEGP